MLDMARVCTASNIEPSAPGSSGNQRYKTHLDKLSFGPHPELKSRPGAETRTNYLRTLFIELCTCS